MSFFHFLRITTYPASFDVRLNNFSQLAGFAKKDDLKYFLAKLCDADYVHVEDLAPTKELLDSYKKKKISWEAYADKFQDLIAQRHIERSIDKSLLDKGCLLCSEHEHHYCHRRLVVEYLNLSIGTASWKWSFGMKAQAIPRVLIAYPSAFACYEKFERKCPISCQVSPTFTSFTSPTLMSLFHGVFIGPASLRGLEFA